MGFYSVRRIVRKPLSRLMKSPSGCWSRPSQAMVSSGRMRQRRPSLTDRRSSQAIVPGAGGETSYKHLREDIQYIPYSRQRH